MIAVVIIVFVVALILIAASFVLGRGSYEVQSARDEEYVELEGAMVRYRVTGGGPPVLLVHGWLSSSRIWEPLVERLAQRFTVYNLDLIGFGDSDKPLSGYGIRHGSRLLHSFCAHFGLRGVAVIGHDIGGNMAFKLATDHPEMVGGIVLVAAPADGDQIDLPTLLWLATLPVVGPIFYALGQRMRWMKAAWMKPFLADSSVLSEAVIEDAGKSTPAAERGTLAAARREISREKLTRRARIFETPALFVAGEEDYIVDPVAAEEWSRNLEQTEAHVIEGCGHMPMIETPDELGDLLLNFLAGEEPAEVESAPDEDRVGSLEDEKEVEASPEVPQEREENPKNRFEKKSEKGSIPSFPESLFEWSEDQKPPDGKSRKDNEKRQEPRRRTEP